MPRRYLRRQEGAVAPQIKPRIAQPMNGGTLLGCQRYLPQVRIWVVDVLAIEITQKRMGMRNENISVASNLPVFYRSFAIIHR